MKLLKRLWKAYRKRLGWASDDELDEWRPYSF
jgi:hypothetical protein